MIETTMTNQHNDLASLGWSPFFQSQLSIDELTTTHPARIAAVHRGVVDVLTADGPQRRIPQNYNLAGEDAQPTVGDWVLLTADGTAIHRLLERNSLFRRRAAGRDARIQLLAANVDTLLVVSSCNEDFNLARIERYLALAKEAGVTPILLLTKADLTDSTEGYVDAARGLDPLLMVEPCDGRSGEIQAKLGPWLGRGQTLALMGSSGVGKSTLLNTLSGGQQATAPIREDDAKGRHTTSSRSMHQLSSGAWLIDTPGMRELQLTDVKEGIEDVFGDIVALARECRFSDCGHDTEPGCAVQGAIESGELEPERLDRFRKLQREEAHNTATIAERHARFRAQGKLYRSIQRAKRGRQEH